MTPAERSNRERDVTARLRAFCGGESASLKQLLGWFNLQNYDTLHLRLRGVPHTGKHRSTRYQIDDVAKKIVQEEATKCT